MKRLVLAAVALVLTACAEPAPIDALPIQPTVALENGIERQDLRFPCGETLCAAWLYLPAGEAKSPVVVMAHGFAGTRDVALPVVAERFAQGGLAALVFDYRNFGSSGGAPRQLVDPWKQLEDWRAALAFVRSHSGVDGTRVALWGTSMGGGLALITGANDNSLRAVVAQVPQVDTSMESEATFPGVFWAMRLLFTGWGSLASEALGFGEWTIPAIAAGDGFGMLVDDRAYEAAERGTPRGSTYRNEVVAHSIFTFDEYNPAVQAAAVKVPVLLIATRGDRYAPFAAAEAFAKSHPNAKLIEIEGDHFDVYTSPHAERAAEQAAQFLKEHLVR